jgi:SAM-dependent methyltransferase
MKQFWDERYAEPHFVYGEAPNVYFENSLKDLSPGKILLPCEGEGRQAVHAAAQGWEVLAFDQSSTGRNKAMQLAATRQVQFTYALADATTFSATPHFDAVALIFAHLPALLRADFHRNMAAALRPGGWLILEGFNPEQLQFQSGGPRDLSMLFTEAMLRSDFEDLEISSLEQKHTTLNEGPYHQGPAAVIRLLARKPLV